MRAAPQVKETLKGHAWGHELAVRIKQTLSIKVIGAVFGGHPGHQSLTQCFARNRGVRERVPE